MQHQIAKQIILQPVEALIPYARNSRTHSDEQVAQIAASIREFGFTNPVLVDDEGGIVAGHGRVMAARQIGMTAVPTINVGWLSEQQRRAYVIADNQLAMNAGWDESILAQEVAWLQDQQFNTDLLGFNADFLDGLLAEESATDVGLTDQDDAPSLQAEPVTRLGDVWVMGKHRLMCGDSTSMESFDTLMAGQQADMIFTDPPYGMSYGGGRAAGDHTKFKRGGGIKAHGMIMNDDLQGEELISLVRDAIATSTACMKKGGALYACFTWRTYSEFESGLEACGHKVSACVVWDKKSIGLGNSNYRPQHEFIFYCGGQWYGDKAESDVWYMSRGNTGAYVHPTQKPVELIERALRNSSKAGDLVIDCFGGSGSTLIACEKNGRYARLMELDPKYCDVIVRRWQAFTGKRAVLESTGQPFPDEAPAIAA